MVVKIMLVAFIAKVVQDAPLVKPGTSVAMNSSLNGN